MNPTAEVGKQRLQFALALILSAAGAEALMTLVRFGNLRGSLTLVVLGALAYRTYRGSKLARGAMVVIAGIGVVSHWILAGSGTIGGWTTLWLLTYGACLLAGAGILLMSKTIPEFQSIQAEEERAENEKEWTPNFKIKDRSQE